MRIVHTSDWHLGHTLKEQDRGPEHAAFLDWLLGRLVEESPDALLIAGDIFDRSNPQPEAVRAWYRFLLAVHTALPALHVVVIGGNHDSGPRLDAPAELLGHFGVRIVGSAPRRADRTLDPAGMLVELRGPAPAPGALGPLLARVAAVPYLRPSDLPGGENPDLWVDAIRDVYASVFGLAPEDGVPLIAMGHSYMVGGQVSELSERKIQGGNLHALPADIFPDRIAYAALGHLHLAQDVGRRNSVRYCGSPIPLALDERAYPHQVCVVDLVPGSPVTVRSLRVPRTVQVPRIPVEGSLSVAEALMRVAAYPADQPAWIEVCVKLEPGEANPRAALEEATEGKLARVLVVTVEGAVSTAGAADSVEVASLSDVNEEDVFRLKWNRRWPDKPLSERTLALFHELVHEVQVARDNKEPR